MRTILTGSSAVLLGVLLAACAATAVRDQAERETTISVSEGQVRLNESATGASYVLRGEIATPALSQAGEAWFLPAAAPHSLAPGERLLIARFPSAPGTPLGYCGAGSEDYAYLLRMGAGSAEVLDRVMLQSCLESVLIESDGAGDPLRRLGNQTVGGVLQFLRSSPPDHAPVVTELRSTNGKLELVEAPVPRGQGTDPGR